MDALTIASELEITTSTEASAPQCAAWCKCVACREKDYASFKELVESRSTLTAWIEHATEKLESIKTLLNHSTEMWQEVQDKYAGESFEDEVRFIVGVKVEEDKDKTEDIATQGKGKMD
jgi:hypothetical protein